MPSTNAFDRYAFRKAHRFQWLMSLHPRESCLSKLRKRFDAWLRPEMLFFRTCSGQYLLGKMSYLLGITAEGAGGLFFGASILSEHHRRKGSELFG